MHDKFTNTHIIIEYLLSLPAMQKAFGDFLVVLKKLGLVLIIYTICRLAFYAFNAQYFDTEGLFTAFIGGLRFDISAIIYVNLAFIVLSLLPFSFRENSGYKKLVQAIYISTNAFAILFNCIDIEYFKFTFKRSTFDLFTLAGTGDDLFNLIPQFLKDFWYLIILFTILVYALIFVSRRIKHAKIQEKWSRKTYLNATVIFLLTLCFSVLGGRGGIQYRPLNLINATLYGKADKLPLILNTPFTIIRSYKADYLEPKTYFDDEKSLETLFSAEKQFNGKEQIHDNVVIIMLESYSYEFLNKKGMHEKYLSPFIDSLATQSLYFETAYANGKKSVEGVPSICSSIPAMMTNPFIFSPYSANKINSLASILKKEDYQSSFFHGGVNGTMGFDAFALSSGFDKYYGKNEYPFEGHDDGTWGIFDEEYFKYFNDEISKQKEPFFSLCFSLTSHHPFKVPKRYEAKFIEAENPYEHVVQYTDYALQEFFNEAKKQDWYDNTLFIITADHTAQSFHPYFRNREGLFRVPLLFFHPTKLVPKKDPKVAQQIDILPTVIDFLGIDQKFVSFGESLLQDEPKYSFQYLNSIYQIENKKYHLEFDGEKSIALYDLASDSLLQKNIIEDVSMDEYHLLEQKLKAIIQSFNDRMINNRLTAE